MRSWRRNRTPDAEPEDGSEVVTRTVDVDLENNRWYDTSGGDSTGNSVVIVPHCHLPMCPHPVVLAILDPAGDGLAALTVSRAQLPLMAGHFMWYGGNGPDVDMYGRIPDGTEGADRAGR